MSSNNYDKDPQQWVLNLLEFTPRRVYRCLCLMYTIKFFKKNQIHNLGKMLTVLSKLKIDFLPIVLMHVDDKTSSFFICSAHLHQVLLSETNYSSASNHVQFPELEKNYCRSCVRHCIQNMCTIYPIISINEE